jgi:hypothetical protein
VKVHHTPIGDLIVLPPCPKCISWTHYQDGDDGGWYMHAATCPLGDGLNDNPLNVGDVVDGDIECPTCDDGLVAGYDYDSGVPTGVCCEDCDGDGTVSVPHEVVAVVPLVANFEGATMPNAVLLVTETGVEWWGCGDNEAHHLADLVLPDAEPGGVALIVERAS